MATMADELLTHTLQDEFQDTVRMRGKSYFNDGRVRISTIDSSSIDAEVKGSNRNYNVFVRVVEADEAIYVNCNCPHFDEGHSCKHIWATFLEADTRNKIRVPDGLDLVHCVAEYSDDDDYTDDDVWEPEDDCFVNEHGDLQCKNPSVDILSKMVTQMLGAHQKLSHGNNIAKRAKAKPIVPDWRAHLKDIATQSRIHRPSSTPKWLDNARIVYVLSIDNILRRQDFCVYVYYQKLLKSGQWGKLQSKHIDGGEVNDLPDPTDREAMGLLIGASRSSMGWNNGYSTYGYGGGANSRYVLSPATQVAYVRALCRTGRCFTETGENNETLIPLTWDEGEPWQLSLDMQRDQKEKGWAITGHLKRDQESMPLNQPSLLTSGGILFDGQTIAPFDDGGTFDWIPVLRNEERIAIPESDADYFLQTYFSISDTKRLQLPEDLDYEHQRVEPRFQLKIYSPSGNGRNYARKGHLYVQLRFAYGDVVLHGGEPNARVYIAESRTLYERDLEVETAAFNRLGELGFKSAGNWAMDDGADLELLKRHLNDVVVALCAEGWQVEAEGRLFRTSGAFEMSVASGIDWFELQGGATFAEQSATLPELLMAVRRGENFVILDDGSAGILPEEWLKRFGTLANLSEVTDDSVRMKTTQVALLDVMLDAMPEVTFDQAVSKARDRLHKFKGIKPRKSPRGFTGELRPYQSEGLGWLHFLRDFGLGGCLADDMGLGKTVQVLSLLESRRQLRVRRGSQTPPSLVVVPKSLIYNWIAEAQRFTPRLRVLDHTGTARFSDTATDPTIDHFNEADVILTTYGTLRRDIGLLKDFRFDYAILDESQAIKNAKTASAKAARLLVADHRLAMTGTPIENHLSELFSLFDFLNPGMLGKSEMWLGKSGTVEHDADTRATLAAAVRPFMLRRTKQQVATDLPDKTEQTMYCVLPAAQRKGYNALRDHYRESLLGRVQEKGLKRSKIQVLEALLRLRQAACHPGLIDAKKTSQTSAKLDMLLPQLREAIDEGHKALVFSQFTSFLKIVRDKLDSEGIVYDYLDGKTRDRAAKVERFQNDPDCKLFLISLKAGGVGLNLTAADYVFLLDPWWNPAVEAQAIDRTHRIGQSRQVFAYRLIARDTVEEKVLQLQASKRELADAIISADNRLIKDLTMEDLKDLLS